MYYQFKRGSKHNDIELQPDGYLYALGRYPTKIKPEDLPCWYVSGYLRGQRVYISARGVKYLVYVPTYNNHLDKDDLLYISYDKPIEQDPNTNSGKWLHGYSHILFGGLVVEYVKATAKYSGYDIRPILAEIRKKQQWFHENFD